ncbi:hypothetical protein [Nocardioides speluncae]|uniref:hypothetical protein n=1 Tax=Nocardioides speluncae TaxID=2670337 RepID=UPI0012B16670|nr:hypothetical protein [Nocardioides speluncae]
MARQRPWRVIVAMAGLTCLLGWLPFLGRPLSPDEGGLLMVARQWAPGDSLYGDYWVDRPPLLIALVAAGDLLGGGSGLRLLGMIAVFASVLLAGLLGRAVSPGVPAAALLPAATAAVLLGTPLFGGSVVNAELLGLPFLLTGMYAALASRRSAGARQALLWGIAAGAAGAGALMIKQNLLDVFVLLLALLVTGDLRQRSRLRGETALGAALGSAGFVCVALAGAAALGTSPAELWSAVVSFRGEATSVLLESPASGRRFWLMCLALLGSGAPLLVGVLLLRIRGLAAGPPAQLDLRLPVLALLVWETAAVLMGGSYWLHYLIGLVPGLVLLAAMSGLPDRMCGPVGLAYGLTAVSTLCVIGWVGLYPIDRSEQEVASWLAAAAQPGDTAVVAFGVPSILESAGLESPYPNLWSLPVRVRDPQLHDFRAVLAGPERPTWLVISGVGLWTWGVDPAAAQPLIKLHYEYVDDVGGYRIFRALEGSS